MDCFGLLAMALLPALSGGGCVFRVGGALDGPPETGGGVGSRMADGEGILMSSMPVREMIS